jgi:glycerophosphoryl diester phosphodiesterase
MSARFRVIAHRGASAHAPENTLPAFERALADGVREVELDVRFSSDLELIVFHDDVLDHKTARSGRVRHYDAATLRRTDVGEWFDRTHPEAGGLWKGTCVVGLEEVLRTLGPRVRYHIEIKDAEELLPLRLLQCLDLHALCDRVTVTSFSLRPLLAVRRAAPELPVCLLLRDAHDALGSAEFRPELEGRPADAVHDYWIDQAAAAGFQQVAMRAADVTPRAVARAADKGVGLRGWGVRDEADLVHLLGLGAVGATVDWPARARAIVDAHPPWADRRGRVASPG